MNHQPFKTWLLSNESLDPEQTKALQAHLATCESCRSLTNAWIGVKAIFHSTQPVQPATGFSERWIARLDTQRQDLANRRQRQSWWFFLIAAALAFSLFLVMIGQIMATFDSPMEIFLSGLYLFTGAIASISTLQGVVITLLNTLVEIVPPIWWIILSSAISGLIIIWLVSLRLVIYPRRVSR